ncbi:MAG: metal ABC transporter ATP-binding protein [Oscillospiraceae bacterium]|jgi:zinc transport system ATP-binding protein|nr:metal ABC transporter ATP-binding protein [Oscillospiraceae bacterium]
MSDVVQPSDRGGQPHHTQARVACGACCLKTAALSVEREGLMILDDINLHVHCGELTCVVGPNGAGKTTLFEALLGVASHTGTISFTDANDGRMRAPKIGYVPQSLNVDRLAPVTVMDFMRASRFNRPVFLPPTRNQRRGILESLEMVGAAALADRRIGAMSGGEAQRVLLALALWPMPNLLLLDEPASGLDAEGRERFYIIVDGLRRALDVSVMLITHDFDMVKRYADRVVLLNRKVLAQGSPSAVLTCADFRGLFPSV